MSEPADCCAVSWGKYAGMEQISVSFNMLHICIAVVLWTEKMLLDE